MGSSNLLKPSSTDEMLMIFIHCPNIHSPLFAPLEDQDGKLFKPWTVATHHFYAFPRDNSPVALILIGSWCWVVISNNLELCNICSLRRQIGTDSINMETTLESSSWMQAASFWSFKSWSLVEKRLDQALFLLASSLLSGAGVFLLAETAIVFRTEPPPPESEAWGGLTNIFGGHCAYL